MRLRRSPLTLVWVVVALWIGAYAPGKAGQSPTPRASAAPSPFVSSTPGPPASGTVAPSPSPTPGPGELTNPFPSPSATAAGPAGNGYAAAGFIAGSASGGQVVPQPNSTSTPSAFPASGGSGFWIDLLGRVGPSYFVSLEYDDLKIHGADNNPLVSYAQGRVLYQPHASRAAFGVGLASVQRSTSTGNMNAFGLGASLLPDLRGGITPYGTFFVYPHMQTGGVSGTFASLDAGLLFVPKAGGFFVRAGGSLRSGLPGSTSPTSVTALQLGVGSSF